MGKGGYGKGSWGWGWGPAWGGGGYRSRPKAAPENFNLPPDRRLLGTVQVYKKFEGYGFLTPDEKGLVPDDKVFVHWKSLQSNDRFPFLTQDMKVEFSIEKVEKRGVMTLAATAVSLPGGDKLALQDAIDLENKTFVGGQSVRYTGTMKFFNPKSGFGYIVIDDGFQYDQEGVPKEIRADSSELNAGGANAGPMENARVEFGIWKNKKDVFKAYNVTLPGGLPLPPTEAEQK
mmetsp:Transcript_106216/g.298663  ORF Transcript_106216/g.298663 Transcript_106216/m.298663 type:complete len:232 (-) Transcript_106216:72-767(-)|eukprot:CAMPEP_0117514834 /NCGR_PEP_ID=MMETSP0784-20121206/30270_1 /TAXON_ID=39447 /ORGANISM="" /LENGTH=231 /DNA_ID=CAMNT_0005310635 /DNA_START=27 /DNA_END=722 /DNA_ORIENTATION=-